MSRMAQAECLVSRAALKDPAARLGIRRLLYEALGDLGHVDRIERYVRDPKDGPIHDSAAGDVDLDQYAIIRVIGYVTPNSA